MANTLILSDCESGVSDTWGDQVGWSHGDHPENPPYPPIKNLKLAAEDFHCKVHCNSTNACSFTLYRFS